MKATSFDLDQSLAVVWEALDMVRDELIPEGTPEYDEQWSEIVTAMAWLQEELELTEETDQ